jgi:hypothetical protein
MRRRRDPFGRVTYVPVRWSLDLSPAGQCVNCGQRDPKDTRSHANADTSPKHRVYSVSVEHDGGRSDTMSGEFCSWDCAEAYHGEDIGR